MWVLGLVFIAGCQGTLGPWANRQKTGKVDEPIYNIEMQKQRARERSPLINDDSTITPNSYSGLYGPGRG